MAVTRHFRNMTLHVRSFSWQHPAFLGSIPVCPDLRPGPYLGFCEPMYFSLANTSLQFEAEPRILESEPPIFDLVFCGLVVSRCKGEWSQGGSKFRVVGGRSPLFVETRGTSWRMASSTKYTKYTKSTFRWNSWNFVENGQNGQFHEFPREVDFVDQTPIQRCHKGCFVLSNAVVCLKLSWHCMRADA